MNIILTRPLNDTENLMQELFKLGHKIMHIPTLKISSANLNPIEINKFKALVFTSSNAVRNLKVKEIAGDEPLRLGGESKMRVIYNGSCILLAIIRVYIKKITGLII